MPYTVYNFDVLTGGGTRALDALSVGALSNGDRAFGMVGGKLLPFLFDAAATDAEDTTNHPFKVRPDDYSTAGVWVEQVPDNAVKKDGDTMTGALTLSGDPTADLHAVPRQYAVALAMANILINPQFTINQRVWTNGGNLAAVGDYFVDRWCAAIADSAPTLSGDTLTIPTGDAVKQIVEAANIPNGTYTIAWAGTSQVKIDGGTAQDSPHTFTVSSGSNVTIEFTEGTLQKPVLIDGSVEVPFVRRIFARELWLCMRYYQKTYKYATTPATAETDGYIQAEEVKASNNFQNMGYKLPVGMRTIPTFTIYNPVTGSTGYAYDSVAGTGRLVTAVNGPSEWGFSGINFNAAFSQSANGAVYGSFHMVADAEL